MTRNEIIGVLIGKGLAYSVKGLAYLKLAQGISPQGAILIKGGTTYGSRIVGYISKTYIRTDFRTEIIFSDAVDAIFFAD